MAEAGQEGHGGYLVKQNEKDQNTLLSKLTNAYLAMLLGVYLIYPGLGGYQSITAQKWQMYLVLTGAYIFLMALLSAELFIVGGKSLKLLREGKESLGLPQKLVLGYLAVTVISTLLSDYRSVAVWGSGRCEGLLTIALYCLSFLLASIFVRPKQWMLWLFAAAVSVNCILAMIQFTGCNPLQLYPEGMNYYDAYTRYSGEFLGTVGNVDILSAVLSLSIPAFAAAIFRMKGRTRFLFFVPLALSLAVLAKAFVAGGILGVSGALLLSVPVLLNGKKPRRCAWLIVAGILLTAAVSVYFLGGRMGGFLYEASELMHGRWSDDFGSGRLYIWRNVMELVPEHPLFGGGPDTLGLRTDAAFERYDETLGILIHSTIDTAHNEYLNILINQGSFGLLTYVAILMASAVRWLTLARKNLTVAVCGCAVLGYCIQAFFGISSPISTPYLWMALALLNADDRQSYRMKEKLRRHL